METVLPRISPAQVAYDQGFTYFHSNRYSEAALEFERAIILDPNYKKAYYGLALAQFHMNNFGEAEKEVEAALRIDPHYQRARELLDAIKSVVPPPAPPPPPPDPPEPKPPFLKIVLNLWQYIKPNLWQYVTGALAFILLVCIVVLAKQIKKKDEDQLQIRMLTNRSVETRSQLDAATSSIQTLSKEKARLIRENQGLQNQLSEQNKQTQTQSATVRKLRNEKEELRNQNRKLQNQLTEQNKETKTRIATIQREKEKLYSQNQTLQDEKEELSSQNQKLQNENATLRNQLELDGRTSSVRTLSNENTQLRREIQGLQNQLTERDKETKTQIAIAKQLRSEKKELHSQNQKLQNENETLLEQLDKRKPSPFLPDHSDQFCAEPLQKIDHSSRQVDSTARSKNNQGLFQWDYNKAIEFFDDARKIDPQCAIIHYNLGTSCLAMKEYAKAINYLDHAASLDPNFKEAYYNLALAYLGRGDRQEAERKTEKSRSIDKNYRPARQLSDYLRGVHK